MAPSLSGEGWLGNFAYGRTYPLRPGFSFEKRKKIGSRLPRNFLPRRGPPRHVVIVSSLVFLFLPPLRSSTTTSSHPRFTLPLHRHCVYISKAKPRSHDQEVSRLLHHHHHGRAKATQPKPTNPEPADREEEHRTGPAASAAEAEPRRGRPTQPPAAADRLRRS